MWKDIAFWIGSIMCLVGFLFCTEPKKTHPDTPLDKKALILSLIGILISFIACIGAMREKYKI